MRCEAITYFHRFSATTMQQAVTGSRTSESPKPHGYCSLSHRMGEGQGEGERNR
jgi:hypothetical protein